MTLNLMFSKFSPCVIRKLRAIWKRNLSAYLMPIRSLSRYPFTSDQAGCLIEGLFTVSNFIDDN